MNEHVRDAPQPAIDRKIRPERRRARDRRIELRP